MPHSLPVAYSPETAPVRVHWTRSQYHHLREQGILSGRYELIEGDIIPKMGQKRAHALVIIRLTAWLVALFGAEFVQFQLPIQMIGLDNDTSEPEPDAAVLRLPASDFVEAAPDASHVLLVIEASDTTLDFDRNTKALLYARSSIPEYWVMDIPHRQLFVHRQPEAVGYAEVTVYAENEQVACLARPHDLVQVADLLPPQSP